MKQGFMTNVARGNGRRLGTIGMACTAALLTAQPMLMPFVARADNGNNNGGYYGNNYNNNKAQGRIGAGASVKVRLLAPISSTAAQVGDRFRVAVASDDTSGLPSGTVFLGQVTQVRSATPITPGSVSIQLALPRGSYVFDQFDTGNGSNGDNSYNSAGANSAGNYNNGNGNAPYGDNGPAPNAITINNDASATFSGHAPKSAGHSAGIAAAAGAILGFARKRKLGDAIEGGAIGGVGGAAYDQTQKRGSSDVSYKTGDEITVHLNRPMEVRTIVVPADEG